MDGSGFRTRAISSSPRRHVLARRLGTRLPLAPFIAPEFNKFDNTGSSGHCRPGTIVGGGLFENAHNNTDLAVECIPRTTSCPSFLPLFAIPPLVCRFHRSNYPHFNAIRAPFFFFVCASALLSIKQFFMSFPPPLPLPGILIKVFRFFLSF